MKSEKQIIADYIEQVESARRQAGNLTSSDLTSIANMLELTENNLKRLKRRAEEHLIRGEGHLANNRLDQAIEALSIASSLSPLTAPPTFALAQAHAARWKKKGQVADRTRAAILGRRCLMLQANAPEVYSFLRTLQPVKKPRNRMAADIITVVLFVLLGGGTLLGLLLRTDNELSAAKKSPSYSSSHEASKPPVQSTLPVTFVPYEPLPGLILEIPRSDLETFEESSTLKLGSIMVNGSDEVIKEATMELLLLAEDGTPLYRQSIEILQPHHARLRSDDRHAFSDLTSLSMSKKNAQTPHHGELRFISVETMDARSHEPEIEPQLLHWEVAKPPGAALAIERRISPRDFASLFHREEYAFSSLPDSISIQRLKLRIDYLGENDVVLSSDESYVVTSAEPELIPGEERLFCFLEPLLKAPEDTRITVVEIQ